VSLFSILGGALALLAGAVAWSARSFAGALVEARTSLPARLDSLKELPWVKQLQEHLPDTDKVVEQIGHYANDALGLLSALGHGLVYALVGLILAVVYLLEEEEISQWRKSLAPRSLLGTLVGWFEDLADAVSVTVQLQLIVAVCNTVFTLPILFLLGIPDKLALMLLIFVTALVPVVGNLISGAVLSLMAWQTSGPVGVGVFIGLTFVLHKAEAYYLNPRLTARHVKLPGFLLICSLIAWESLLGFAGLFVSFPFLFVLGRIRADFKEQEALELTAVASAHDDRREATAHAG
jgi:putative heme transporter